MKRAEVLNRLRGEADALRQMGVASLALFGSVAREEATDASDVDLVVDFDRPVGYFHVFRVQDFLEQCLDGMPVHLVLRTALIDEVRPAVEREAVDVVG